MNYIFWGLMGLFWATALLYWFERRSQRRMRIILRDLEIAGPSYGLDIVKRNPAFIKRGTVYVLLHRLEDSGCVISEDTSHVAVLSRG